MKFRPEAIEIPPENPFQFDLLNRKTVGDSLTEIVRSSSGGLVLALHAPWGQGKTTFLKMWQQSLINSSATTIYFNAWQTDFSEDALVSLIGELNSGLKSAKDGEGTVKLQESVASAKKFGAKILRRTVPALIKLGTAGVLTADDFTEEVVSGLGEKIAEDKIQDYEDAKSSIQGFRSAIEEIAKESSEIESLPLVIIVDELDRCRPTYAISILECIKHLFSVEGVVFVLSIDRTQLSHAVRSQYGVGMDANGYLRRFFDIELNLPEPSHQQFIQAQFARFGLLNSFKTRSATIHSDNEKSNFTELFLHLFRCMQCSLRDQERAFSLLSLALRATSVNEYLHPDLMAVLIVLKIKDTDSYEKFVNGVMPPDAILDRLAEGPGGREFIATQDGVIVEAVLRASVCPSAERESLHAHYRDLANGVTSQASCDKSRATEILRLFSIREIHPVFGRLKRISSKIDLAISMQA